MADTYPSPAWLDDTTVGLLNGTTDQATGLPYLAKGISPSSTPSYQIQYDRAMNRLITLLGPVAQCWLVREASLLIGVFPGDYTLGGTHKHFDGATAQAVTDDATKVWYIDAANALVEAASYPVDITTFLPLATVVAASGAITSITDDRGHALRVVPQTTSSSDSGTNNATFIIDEDNAGAGADTSLLFNRGSTAADARLQWNETDDRFELDSSVTVPTKAILNLLALYISGTLTLDSNGAAKVAAAVAGAGLDHAAGVLSIPTSSANGLSLDGGNNLVIDPSDGITLDANGVAVAFSASGGLAWSAGAAGSRTLEVSPDDATIENDVGGLRVKAGGIDGTHHANSGSNGTGLIVVSATLVAGNTVTIWSAAAPYKCRVIDAWSIATSADGGTWKVDNGTDAITDVVTVTGTDKTINRAGTIDDAKYEIAPAGSLRVVGDGANADCIVKVMLEKVA